MIYAKLSHFYTAKWELEIYIERTLKGEISLKDIYIEREEIRRKKIAQKI